jgi:hypothetical protein
MRVLRITRSRGSDVGPIRKLLKLHRFERSTRHSNPVTNRCGIFEDRRLLVISPGQLHDTKAGNYVLKLLHF